MTISLANFPVSRHYGKFVLSEVGQSSDYKFSSFYREKRQTANLFDLAYQHYGYPDLMHWSYRIRNCASRLTFAETSKGLRLRSANFCRVRFCPMCSFRRSKMYQAKSLSIWPHISKKFRYIFLTLTVRNPLLTQLRSYFKYVLTPGFKRFKDNLTYNLKSLRGYLRCFEVTMSKSDESFCHPHFHLLIAVDDAYFDRDNYLDYSGWQSIWRDALRLDYNPQVWVEAVLPDDSRSLLELTKYEFKPSDYVSNYKWVGEAAVQVSGLRSFSHSGIFSEYFRFLNTDPDLIFSESEYLDKLSNKKSDYPLINFTWDNQLNHYVSEVN
ncbi:protein rep [Okeania sp. SIO2B3]|uniref:protein rep n=1 Tax=Okeania sp. SIO2B3 TaxID=2607784 RepID=UPI0013BFAECF|nr:protein rep [Okeania sp. SIO2B3]NET46710.1 protein rep [Okeania sp. SIO2B3]